MKKSRFTEEQIVFALKRAELGTPVTVLVHTMLEKAFLRLNPGDTPLLHSDQGWQYQMVSYQEKLKTKGVFQSMSRKGNCLDNAMAESFFSTLKSECFYLEKY
jgi:Transposase and inactivated derivatives